METLCSFTIHPFKEKYHLDSTGNCILHLCCFFFFFLVQSNGYMQKVSAIDGLMYIVKVKTETRLILALLSLLLLHSHITSFLFMEFEFLVPVSW